MLARNNISTNISEQLSTAEAAAKTFLTYILRHPRLEPAVTEANRELFLKEGTEAFKTSVFWLKFEKALTTQEDYRVIAYDKFKGEVKKSVADFGIRVYSTHIKFYADELRHAFNCTVIETAKEFPIDKTLQKDPYRKTLKIITSSKSELSKFFRRTS